MSRPATRNMAHTVCDARDPLWSHDDSLDVSERFAAESEHSPAHGVGCEKDASAVNRNLKSTHLAAAT